MIYKRYLLHSTIIHTRTDISKENFNDQVHGKIPKEEHAMDDGLDDNDCLELQKGYVDMS